MDPQAAWNEMLDAYRTQDWQRAEEHAEALLTWIDGRGFPPKNVIGQEMDERWDREIARAACVFVISMAEDREEDKS